MPPITKLSADYSPIPSLADAPEVLTGRQVRAIFNISHSSLNLSISQGYFPAPIRIGKSGKRWLKSALVSFVLSQANGGSSDGQ